MKRELELTARIAGADADMDLRLSGDRLTISAEHYGHFTMELEEFDRIAAEVARYRRIVALANEGEAA